LSIETTLIYLAEVPHASGVIERNPDDINIDLPDPRCKLALFSFLNRVEVEHLEVLGKLLGVVLRVCKSPSSNMSHELDEVDFVGHQSSSKLGLVETLEARIDRSHLELAFEHLLDLKEVVLHELDELNGCLTRHDPHGSVHA